MTLIDNVLPRTRSFIHIDVLFLQITNCWPRWPGANRRPCWRCPIRPPKTKSTKSSTLCPSIMTGNSWAPSVGLNKYPVRRPFFINNRPTKPVNLPITLGKITIDYSWRKLHEFVFVFLPRKRNKYKKYLIDVVLFTRRGKETRTCTTKLAF